VGGFIGLAGHHQVYDELHGSQGLAPAADEECCVRTLHVDDCWIVGARAGTANGGQGINSHTAEHTGDCRERGASVSGILVNGPNADLCRLGADAEDACAALANDVYLDPGAFDVEFEKCDLYRLLHRLPRHLQALVQVRHIPYSPSQVRQPPVQAADPPSPLQNTE